MALIMVQIVTYNSAETIDLCLDSVLSQRGVEFDLCVVDNASSDETVQRVQAFDVPIIQNNINLGYGAAHNQALARSDTPYVLTLNPDVCLESDYLLCLLEAVEQDEGVGSAMGCLLRTDTLGNRPYQIDSTGLYMRRNRRQGLRGEGLPVQHCGTLPAEIFGPDGAAALYRRAMLEDIRVLGEVFDADFFLQKEDVDLCWRARIQGWSSICVADAVGQHIRSFRPGQRQGVAPELRFYGTRNRYLLMLKNDSAAHLLRDLACVLFYDLGILLYVLLVERETLRALPAAFKLRRRMLEKRRVIQARRVGDWRALRRWFRGE